MGANMTAVYRVEGYRAEGWESETSGMRSVKMSETVPPLTPSTAFSDLHFLFSVVCAANLVESRAMIAVYTTQVHL